MDDQSIVRRLVLFVLLLLAPEMAGAMEHFVRPLQDQNGRAIAGATVSIYIAGSTTLATLYSDNGATVKSNPITTGVDGMMDFYAANGLYDLAPVAKGYVFNVNQYKRLAMVDPTDVGGGPAGSCVRTVSGTSDTILASDSGCIVIYTDTGIVSVSIPQAGIAGFGTSFNVQVLNLNAAQVILTPDGSTIQGDGTLELAVGQSTDIRSDGANYYHAPGIKNITGWPQSDAIKEITWAATESSAEAVGDGVRKVRRWCDATNGCIEKPDPVGDTFWRIWPGFEGCARDEQNNSNIFCLNPDAFGVGSGTLTMQTGEQLVASNLGVEFSESDTNPSCISGKYTIYADLSEAKIKKCQNGTISDLAPVAVSEEEIFIRKTADETVNNSAVLQNDNALVIPVDANSTYMVRVFVLYDSSTTADLRYAFTLPAGASGTKTSHNASLSTTNCSSTSGVFLHNDITQTNANVGGAGAVCGFEVLATVVTAGTAGNVTFQWAQATAETSNTRVLANSWASYRKIP